MPRKRATVAVVDDTPPPPPELPPPQKRPIEFRWLPIDSCVPNDWNINSEDDITFNLLQDEIATVGFIDPIEVVPLEDGTFVILSGEHRWRAAKNLNHDEVPAILLTEEKWQDVELQQFVSVRFNVLHGKTDPDKFIALYNQLVVKHGPEAMQRLMGYADTRAFEKMVSLVKKGLAKSLPKEMSKELEEKTKDVRSVQDLERIIQELFAKYGDTCSQSFMIFTYGKQQHLYIAMDSKMRRAMDKATECCRLTGQDINDFMRPIVEEFVRKAAKEIEQRENSKVAEPKTEW